MKTKDPRDVVHEVAAVEEYLDQLFSAGGVTFEQWVTRFGRGVYRDRNKLILKSARPLRPTRVLEFACAGPFLARLLVENLPTIRTYVCSNFSQRMVNYCTTALRDLRRCRTELLDVDVTRSSRINSFLDAYDLFVTTSLEHIQFDRDLIAKFPVDSRFIFSVTAFDDPEHFRVFRSADEIVERYDDLLNILDIRRNRDRNKFVVVSIRKCA